MFSLFLQSKLTPLFVLLLVFNYYVFIFKLNKSVCEQQKTGFVKSKVTASLFNTFLAALWAERPNDLPFRVV